MQFYVAQTAPCKVLDTWAHQYELIRTEAEGVRIYSGRVPESLATAADDWLRQNNYKRLFERCYLPAAIDGGERRICVQVLFSVLSRSYDSEIHREVNIACYDYLLSGIKARTKCAPNIALDFGCGPATILSSSVSSSFSRVVGFDFVEENRMLASSRGLSVLNAQELSFMPPQSFGAIFSAYVLHYESLSAIEFKTLEKVLKTGGIWGANFHKSIGVGWFNGMLSAEADASWQVDWEESQYGQVMFMRKLN